MAGHTMASSLSSTALRALLLLQPLASAAIQHLQRCIVLSTLAAPGVCVSIKPAQPALHSPGKISQQLRSRRGPVPARLGAYKLPAAACLRSTGAWRSAPAADVAPAQRTLVGPRTVAAQQQCRSCKCTSMKATPFS